MKIAVCTISTKSHLFKSRALLKSVSLYSSASIFCLITDGNEHVGEQEMIHYDTLETLQSETAIKIKKKYKGDSLRWALKPIYLKHLLLQDFDAVIYCDNDIYFYNSLDFIFDDLTENSFIITPHFYKANPLKEQNWLEANFRVGLYNAGFIGANLNGIEILDWWANCCLYNIKKSYWRGLYDDQKYLDLIPILFENVKILKHRGCNVAGWNQEGTFVEKEKNGTKINGDLLVFIHFAALSMEMFSNQKNPLHDEWKQYIEALKKEKNDFEYINNKFQKNTMSAYFYYLRWLIVRKLET